jgi:hypothetical protein
MRLGAVPVCNAAGATYVVDDPSLITGIRKITILPIVVLADLPVDREGKLTTEVRNKLAKEKQRDRNNFLSTRVLFWLPRLNRGVGYIYPRPGHGVIIRVAEHIFL